MNAENQPAEEKTCHFMATALAFYEKEEAIKQRHVNIHLETDSPNLTKEGLAAIQRGVVGRLQAENDVKLEDVKDIVIMNIVLLGVMSAAQFHGEPVENTVN